MAINRSKKTRAGVVPPEEFSMQGTGPGVLDAAIEIAEEIRGWLGKLKEALLSEDDVQLKLYARKLCGLPSEPQPETQKPTIKRKRT